jgi:hypothetical protein
LKLATDLIDDGQFGQAVVLTQFNYANGYSEGLEFKAKYQNDGFYAYANVATGRAKAKDVVSNQYLFDDPVEFAYINNNYHFIDDAQLITASAGASYRWDNTLVSLDGIYGYGLRQGFANLEQQQPYTQFNFAIARDFDIWPNAIWPSAKPLNLRFTVVNLLDNALPASERYRYWGICAAIRAAPWLLRYPFAEAVSNRGISHGPRPVTMVRALSGGLRERGLSYRNVPDEAIFRS